MLRFILPVAGTFSFGKPGVPSTIFPRSPSWQNPVFNLNPSPSKPIGTMPLSAADFQNMTDEEAMSRVRATFLGGLEWVNHMEDRLARRRQTSMQKAMEFNKLHFLIEKTKESYQQTLEEKNRAVEAFVELSGRHADLSAQSKSLEERIKELEAENMSVGESLAEKKEELSQQALSFSRKISELETASTGKDALLLEKDKQIAELEKCHEGTEAENVRLKEDLRKQTDIADSNLRHSAWLLRRGIPGLFKAFLQSEEFLERNTALQAQSVSYGAFQGSRSMRDRYLSPEVELTHNFPEAEGLMTSLFGQLLNSDYPFINAFESGAATLNDVKAIVDKVAKPPSDEGIGESSNVKKD